MNEEERQKLELIKSNSRLVENDSKIMKDVIEKHEGVRERAIRYTYQLITAIGIVAGFGFTAISSVETISMFIIGELLLFSAMAFGMRFVKKGFIDEAKLYVPYISKLGRAINDRSNIRLDDSLKNIKDQMDRISNSELKIFDDNKPADINSERTFNVIFYLFIGGGVLLLLSFVDFYKLLFCV